MLSKLSVWDKCGGNMKEKRKTGDGLRNILANVIKAITKVLSTKDLGQEVNTNHGETHMPSPHKDTELLISSARLLYCSCPSGPSPLYRDGAATGGAGPWPRAPRRRGRACSTSPGDSQSLRGKRHRAPEEDRSHQASTQQGCGHGVTWEGGPGTGRGGGTGCYSTRTSPCSGGTPCQGRSPPAP